MVVPVILAVPVTTGIPETLIQRPKIESPWSTSTRTSKVAFLQVQARLWLGREPARQTLRSIIVMNPLYRDGVAQAANKLGLAPDIIVA